jgi:hypothetical protein
MKPKKSDTEENKPKRKYAKRISMYPLNPGEVLAAFMQVPPRKRKRKKKEYGSKSYRGKESG